MHPSRGFTLIELLVVIAIIGILSSIVLVSLNTARAKGEIAAGKSYAAAVDHALGHVAVGTWKMDESVVGGTAADDSGNGNTCTINGTVTSTSGVHGNAFTFDGSTGYLSCGSNSDLALSSKWTIMLWVLPSVLISQSTLVSGDGAADTSGAYNVYLSSVGAIQYENNNLSSRTSTGRVVTGKWQHVSVVYDESTSTMTFYINGAAAGSGPITAPSAFGYLLIGKRGLGSFFTGSIDEVRIYNQALTTSQIEDVYKNQLALFSRR